MTVIENIQLSSLPDKIWSLMRREISGEEQRRIAEDVELKEGCLSMYPNELAVGDLQRLELARAIATNPKIILLDEIFAGLTVAESSGMCEVINKKREQGLSFAIISHDLRAFAPVVDRVVVINFGEFIAEGAFEKVIEEEKVKKAYFGY